MLLHNRLIQIPKIMKRYTLLFLSILLVNALLAQVDTAARTKVMTLGVFHFAYNNLDVVKTAKEDQVSVLDEPYQSEIIAIARAIEEFKPTIIAIEVQQPKQRVMDSLYQSYVVGNHALKRSEVQQLGFRIGKSVGIPTLYCVDDWGAHYPNVMALFTDSLRADRFTSFQLASHKATRAPRIGSIIGELEKRNNPVAVQESLAGYLQGIFLYEEKPGDYVGVDFQSGRWFNRNLRIFRNVQRIPKSSNDRVLLIIGADHINLLNYFFDVSHEFELVSPMPYLNRAQEIIKSNR